ncbi:hypothetical protein FOBRF1_014778 [Fusarium oxysporum]
MSVNLKMTAPHLPGHRPSGLDTSKNDASQPEITNTDIPRVSEGAVITTIHFTDGSNDKEAFYLKLLKSHLDDETLSDLRSNIAGLTGSIEISHFPFCGKKGAVVPDSFYVQDYLTECLGINPREAKTLDIYMKDTSSSPKSDAGDLCDIFGINNVAELKHQVGDVAFKWITGTQAKYVPELEQRDWAIISESNALCYGLRVIRVQDPTGKAGDPRGVPVGIERARCPARTIAFRLKKRTIWSDDIATSTIDGVKLDLRIPDYIIDDKSYMAIYETETSMQSSMATSSFSETDVAAAGKASFMGFSGSASMKFAKTSSEAATSSKSSSCKKVTIAYNFPRVTVFLDSRSLELTTDCMEALYDLKTEADIENFHDAYGEFFSTRVQLGGRLFATESTTDSSESSTKDTVKSMKIAAAASFRGWGVSAKLSASHKEGNEKHESKESHESATALTWQANGGDTLLCNQPLEWAPTVAYHWNWRITKQDHIASIFDVVGQIKGMGWIISDSTQNPKDAVAKPRKISPAPAKTFSLSVKGPNMARYLLTYPANACNIGVVAEARNAAGKNTFKLNSDTQSRGCVLLSREQLESYESNTLYEAEDSKGQLVAQLRYNTRYRLKNRETGLYVDYHFQQGYRFLFGNPTRSKTYFISFKSGESSTNTDVIPNNARAYLSFEVDEPGLVYPCATDGKRWYLFCSRPDQERDADMMLSISYQ